MAKIKDFNTYVKENVNHIAGAYKVNTIIDIPQSLINAYAKKVKEETGKDIKKMYSDSQIAEEMVKAVCAEQLVNDNLKVSWLMGEKEDGTDTNEFSDGEETTSVTDVNPNPTPQAEGETAPSEDTVNVSASTDAKPAAPSSTQKEEDSLPI